MGNGRAPGASRLGVLLAVVVAALGVYLAFKFIPPYWTYLSMQDPVQEAALAAVMPSREARAQSDLIARAQEMGLPLSEQNIEFQRDERTLVVRVSWVATVELPTNRYEIPFQIEERIPLR